MPSDYCGQKYKDCQKKEENILEILFCYDKIIIIFNVCLVQFFSFFEDYLLTNLSNDVIQLVNI